MSMGSVACNDAQGMHNNDGCLFADGVLGSQATPKCFTMHHTYTRFEDFFLIRWSSSRISPCQKTKTVACGFPYNAMRSHRSLSPMSIHQEDRKRGSTTENPHPPRNVPKQLYLSPRSKKPEQGEGQEHVIVFPLSFVLLWFLRPF